MVSHAMKRKEAAGWWLSQKAAVAKAVDDAERATGHQIVVAVGKLGRRPDVAANRVARKQKGATIVFCVDPLDRRFELRWASTVLLPEEVITQTSRLLAEQRLCDAIALVATVLPVQAEGEELPDIVED
ncbi:MAG: hypothetical protein ACKO3L_09390 [Actinomycetota bacterium]